MGCGASTLGPSDKGETGISSVGMACHIAGASSGPGSIRYLPIMLKTERQSISNGIWMCYTHGKLIDADEKRFTIKILKEWKNIAERIAMIMLDTGCDYAEALKYFHFKDLIRLKISLNTRGDENSLIANALNDCGLPISWGANETHAARDFVIEYVRNAYIHGHATEVTLEAIENKLIISDNGNEFNPKKLLKNEDGSGGTRSLRELIENFNDRIIFFTTRENNSNRTTIGLIKGKDDILAFTPCSIKVDVNMGKLEPFEINVSDGCNEIFIVLSDFLVFSDLGILDAKFSNLKKETRPVTIVFDQISGFVKNLIREKFPHFHFFDISII